MGGLGGNRWLRLEWVGFVFGWSVFVVEVPCWFKVSTQIFPERKSAPNPKVLFTLRLRLFSSKVSLPSDMRPSSEAQVGWLPPKGEIFFSLGFFSLGKLRWGFWMLFFGAKWGLVAFTTLHLGLGVWILQYSIGVCVLFWLSWRKAAENLLYWLYERVFLLVDLARVLLRWVVHFSLMVFLALVSCVALLWFFEIAEAVSTLCCTLPISADMRWPWRVLLPRFLFFPVLVLS